MNSSGIKRGLAATAVSALAVTGLPFLATSASATPLDAQAGGADQVVLYSLFNSGNDVTVKPSGTDATTSLVAAAGVDIVSVTFQYSLGGGVWNDIATVATRNAQGAFATEWDPTSLAGATVSVRAQAFKAAAVDAG